jgi:hydrogenase maturation factor
MSGSYDPAPICDLEAGCITCGDEAVPMRVERVDAARELALCQDDAGRRSSVEIALVQPVAVGEVLLVHAGTAIAKRADAAPGAVPNGGAGTGATA